MSSDLDKLVKQIEQSSPDIVVELISPARRLAVIADLKKKVIARGYLTDHGIEYDEYVIGAVPTRITAYESLLESVTIYKIEFDNDVLSRPLRIIGTIEEIANRLKIEGLVYRSELLMDTLSAIIRAFIKRHRASILTTINAPGFYDISGYIIWHIPEPIINKDKLRQALALLDKLATTQFKYAQDRFATVVKWGAASPFFFVLKQRGWPTPWLCLYGKGAVGKPTLGHIVLAMWGLDNSYEVNGADINTAANLGDILSRSTFPTLMNEAEKALTRKDIKDTVIYATEDTVVRSKLVQSIHTDILALSPLIIASSEMLLLDRTRFVYVNLSSREKVPTKFMTKANLELLSEIGNCIARATTNWELSEGDVIAIGEKLLVNCYEIAKMPIPSWLKLRYDRNRNAVEEFREKLRMLINDSYEKYVKSKSDTTLEKKLRTLLASNSLPYIKLKDNDKVVISAEIMRGLRIDWILQSLAKHLGWQYGVVQVGKATRKGATVTIDALIKFLTEQSTN